MKSSWQRRQLGDVATLSGRIGWRGLTAKEYTQEGPWFLSVHSLNYGDHVDFRDAFHISLARYQESPEIMLRPGDVLICKDGAGIGKVGIVKDLPGSATINSSLLLVRARDNLRPKFLYHCLCSPYFQRIVQSRLNGATTPHLYQRDITEFPVEIPPLTEQDRIVEILDEAFEAIGTAKGNAERSFRSASELRTSHQAQAVSVAAEGCPLECLEDLVTPDCTLSYGIVQPGDDVADGLPVVRPVDLVSDFISVDGLKRVDPAVASSYQRTTLRGEDLLLCVRGTTGTVAIASPELAGANVTRGIVPIRFPSERLSARLGYFLLRSEPVQQQIKAKTYGAALMQINIGDLRKVVLAVPPLEQQGNLLEKLETIQESTQQLQRLCEEKLRALDELKKSLLHHAFTGQLTAKKTDQLLGAAV